MRTSTNPVTSRPPKGGHYRDEKTFWADRTFARLLGLVAVVGGAAAAWLYFHQGLTLSHYDAKAHLVVARRILDSRTPGWAQIGAVWLPLPHLLNALPVQIDTLYRTGLSGAAISVAAFALTIYASSRLILHITGSRVGAVAAAVALGANPNVLYLQATPMTESLLLGLTAQAVLFTYEWVRAGGQTQPRAAGWTLVALCLTRYEGWLITAAAIGCAALALWRQGAPIRLAAGRAARLALYPTLAVLAFAVHSRVTVGEWMVTGGFFVPDNPAAGRPLSAVAQTVWGTWRLTGYTLTIAGIMAAVVLGIRALRSREHSSGLIVLALGGCALLPWYAFLLGHPFRIRYMVPVAAATAIWSGMGIGLLGRGQLVAAVVLIGLASFEVPPLDPRSPVLVETQWDLPNSLQRRAVTACLASRYRGEPILMSMGSLAHYMQELSHEGFAIRDFVHEGNHPEWEDAIATPQGRVGWILIEEQAEGGDVLATRARRSPAFLHGFQRLCSGGGVALYQAAGSIPLLAAR